MRREAREALERAKEAGFVYSRRLPDVADQYFNYCSRSRLPYVRIRADYARIWANDVSVDMFSTNNVLTDTACDFAIAALKRHADRRARLMTGPVVVAADRVHRDHWEPLARELFAIATAPGAQISLEDLQKSRAAEETERARRPRRQVNQPRKLMPDQYDELYKGLNRRQIDRLSTSMRDGFVMEREAPISPATQGAVAGAYRRYCEMACKAYIAVFCGWPRSLRIDMSPTGNDITDEAFDAMRGMLQSMQATHMHIDREPFLKVIAVMSQNRCETAAYILTRELGHAQLGMLLPEAST